MGFSPIENIIAENSDFVFYIALQNFISTHFSDNSKRTERTLEGTCVDSYPCLFYVL